MGTYKAVERDRSGISDYQCSSVVKTPTSEFDSDFRVFRDFRGKKSGVSGGANEGGPSGFE